MDGTPATGGQQGRSTRAHYTFAHDACACVLVCSSCWCWCWRAIRRGPGAARANRSRSPAGTSCSAPRSSATFAPDDPGFFNYTELRIQRAAQPPARRVGGDSRQRSRAGARRSPARSRRRVLEAVRVVRAHAAVAGAPLRHPGRPHSADLRRDVADGLRQQQHPDRPAARLSVPDVAPADALPATADDLLRMRGRGWLSNFPVGNTVAGPGLPLVNTSRWDTGVQVHGVDGHVEWTGAVTTGSLSDPRVSDNNGGRSSPAASWCGRLPAMALGVSASRGAWLNERSRATVAGATARGRVAAGAFGVDAEYLARAVPGARRGDSIGVDAAGVRRRCSSTSRWSRSRRSSRAATRSCPGFYVAARGERLGFSTVRGERGLADMGGADVALRDRRRLFDHAQRHRQGVVAAQPPRRRPRAPRHAVRGTGALLVLKRACAAIVALVALRRRWRACEPAAATAAARPRRRSAAGSTSAGSRKPVERRPDVATPGARRPARPARPAPRRRLPRDRAARRRSKSASPAAPSWISATRRSCRTCWRSWPAPSSTFPTATSTYHNVFSLSRAKRFDLGRYAAGQSKSRALRSAGRRARVLRHPLAHERVRAGLHPSVLRRHRRRRPLPLDDVPPGTYTVVGWYEGEARVTRSVTVPAGGWADLDLVVP